MKVRTCPECGERWWCTECGVCHNCGPDIEPPNGVAVRPQGRKPTLPAQKILLVPGKEHNEVLVGAS